MSSERISQPALLQATGLGGGRVSRPHGAKLAHRLGEGGIDLVRVEVRIRVRVRVIGL